MSNVLVTDSAFSSISEADDKKADGKIKLNKNFKKNGEKGDTGA
jgi:hypothetical protein